MTNANFAVARIGIYAFTKITAKKQRVAEVNCVIFWHAVGVMTATRPLH